MVMNQPRPQPNCRGSLATFAPMQRLCLSLSSFLALTAPTIRQGPGLKVGLPLPSLPLLFGKGLGPGYYKGVGPFSP